MTRSLRAPAVVAQHLHRAVVMDGWVYKQGIEKGIATIAKATALVGACLGYKLMGFSTCPIEAGRKAT